MRPTTVLLLGLLALGAAACGEDEAALAAPPYTAVTEATVLPGDDVPTPSDDVVLTLTGDIGTTNDGGALLFDMATLESLGTVSYTVDDYQALGGDVTFTGVLLSDLLAVAEVDDAGATLHTIALNDYAVDIPAGDAADYPVLLATRADGERMPVEAYGPLRIVYPTHAFDLDPSVHDPRWIWQLDEIEVR